ncbi:MAG: SAM-dependent chlorinase/fluorinase [Gemmatimonadales bacterium]|jgi:S-adenosylmethionine hydrolase
MSRVVTLLTDFGTADGYVGEVKGTLLTLAPGATLVDIAHDIPAGDVAAACYVLERVWRSFPAGTVHLAVVDPGVGSARRALAAEAGGHCFVAPDNGLLTAVFAAQLGRVVQLPIPAEASRTFHGRDVFAPAAARLATGAALQDLGAALADPVRLPTPLLRVEAGDLVGEVIHVDRFGTLVTNLPREHVAPDGRVRVAGHDLPLKATFADVGQREPVAFVGSGGALEIAVRDGRADVVLGLSRGTEVRATARRS